HPAHAASRIEYRAAALSVEYVGVEREAGAIDELGCKAVRKDAIDSAFHHDKAVTVVVPPVECPRVHRFQLDPSLREFEICVSDAPDPLPLWRSLEAQRQVERWDYGLKLG